MPETVERVGLQEDGSLIVHITEGADVRLELSGTNIFSLVFPDRTGVARFANDILRHLPETDHPNVDAEQIIGPLARLITNEPNLNIDDGSRIEVPLAAGALREFSQGKVVFSDKNTAIKTFLTVLPEGSVRTMRSPYITPNLFNLFSVLGHGFYFDEKLHEVATIVSTQRGPAGLNEKDATILNAIRDRDLDMCDPR